MFEQRKGITPVIAIVLLLLITVGAVGVVYTQFQDLVGNNEAEDELRENTQIQQSSYSIIAVTQSGSSYEITLKNTGSENINLTEKGVVLVGKDGAQTRAVESYSGGTACDFGVLSEGETDTCNTGVSWGTEDDGQGTTIELQVGEVVKASSTCYESGGACQG